MIFGFNNGLVVGNWAPFPFLNSFYLQHHHAYLLLDDLEKENILINLSTVPTKENIHLMETWHLGEIKSRASVHDTSPNSQIFPGLGET